MAGQVRRRGAYDQSRVEQRPIDTRSFFSRVLSDLESPDGLMMAIFLIGILATLGALVPMIAGLSFIPIYVICRKFMHPKLRLHNFPFRVPAHLGVPDGSKKDFAEKGNVMENLNTFKPEGKQFWGVSREDRLQVWASIGDLKTHMAVLGGTGSGKTELLYALTLNQLVQDSGFIYTDAKGDIVLQDRILEQLRRFDRHEDLLVITFAAGNRDLSAAQPTRITNTFNIMSSNSDSMLIEIISGMVSSSETGADMWEGRCLAFVAAITRPLVFLRDRGIIDLSPAVYMENMELSTVEQMVWESHPDEAHGIDHSLGALKAFLFSLPGYAPAKKYKQDQKTNEQFGYISMQLTRVFSDLGFNYGHIFDAKVGEIDVSDVVLNRRCLNILLPSLERSDSTLTMLGRLIMGSIKQMMAGSLGSSIEGSQRLIVEARPTNAENVFRVILDEVGYIMVPGMSITTAQARALNIAMTFAAQTFSDLKRGNAHEAEAIWENTSLKLIGRLMGGEEQSSETWQKVIGMAGHAQEAVISGYYKKTGAFSNTYHSSDHISVQRTARIEVDYLRSMQDGEFILFGAKKIDGGAEGDNMIVPMNVLWAKSETKAPYMRINDLIPISKAGTRLDNSQAKNTLKSYLQTGSLHEQFQKMADERRKMAWGSFASLSLFEELCELSLTETQHSGLILPINFYKNLCDHVIVNSSDELSKIDAFEHANVKAGCSGETTSTAAATSLQTSQWIMADGNFSRDKNMFSEDDDLSYKGAAHRVATESEPSEAGSDAVLTDSLHQTKVYAKSKRHRRTRVLDG